MQNYCIVSYNKNILLKPMKMQILLQIIFNSPFLSPIIILHYPQIFTQICVAKLDCLLLVYVYVMLFGRLKKHLFWASNDNVH